MESRTAPPLEELDPQQLVELLGDSEFARSQAAAENLFERGVLALDALAAGLSHTNWRVRKNCAGLMDHLGDDRCIEPLQRALNDPIVGVRRLAVHALGCQPCKQTPLRTDITGLLIERALTDSSIQVRRVATHMLGLQPYDTRAVDALEAIVRQQTDPKQLSRARHALEEHQKKAVGEPPASCPTRR